MRNTPPDWIAYIVRDFIESDTAEMRTGPYGSQLHASDYVETGTPVINARHIKFGGISQKDLKFVNNQTTERLAQHKLRTGDIIFARVGPTERHALIDESQSGWLQGTQCIRLRFKSPDVNSQFVSYSFNTPRHIRWMINRSGHGTAQPYINQEVVCFIPLLLPPIEIQNRIALALSSYDTLIENNRRRIELLEEMARVIYCEWFVHFRFPGHEEVEMVGSELGKIPKGWDMSTLGKECTLIIGLSPKSEFYNEEGEGLPFHQGVKDFGAVTPSHRIYCTIDRRVAESGDILFSVRAPVGRINLADTKLIVGRGLHAIRHNQKKQAFLLYQLKNRFFKEDLMGGGTVFQAVTKADMLGIEMLIPPANLIDEFEVKVGPMVQLMVNLVIQNQTLTQTRDLLLPRLVSGRIDASNLHIEILESSTYQKPKYSDKFALDRGLDGDDEYDPS